MKTLQIKLHVRSWKLVTLSTPYTLINCSINIVFSLALFFTVFFFFIYVRGKKDRIDGTLAIKLVRRLEKAAGKSLFTMFRKG